MRTKKDSVLACCEDIPAHQKQARVPTLTRTPNFSHLHCGPSIFSISVSVNQSFLFLRWKLSYYIVKHLCEQSSTEDASVLSLYTQTSL